MNAFHFLRPAWLLALLPAGLLLLGLWRARAAGSAWGRVIEARLLRHLWLSAPGRASRLALWWLGLGWLIAVIALAGPTWRRLPVPAWQSMAARVVVLDLSPSMAGHDLAPSRLARARFKIRDLLHRPRRGRIGLVVFAGEAHLVSPLTDDAATVANLLAALSTDIVPVRGSNAAPALRLAAQLLRQGGARPGEVVLLSDGVDDISEALAASRQLRRAGYRLAVIGVGTARLRAGPLRALARAGGGAYARITADDRDLDRVLQRFDRQVALSPEQRQKIERWAEAGVWLLPVLLLIALGGFRRGWLMSWILLVALPPPAHALGWQDLWWRPDQQAARLLDRGKAADAARRFQDPAWRGMARYRAGDYLGAAKDFAQAGGVENRYNQANALARAGRLREAIHAYQEVLGQRPRHRDARKNLALLKRLLQQRQQQANPGRSGPARQKSPGARSHPTQPRAGEQGERKRQNPQSQQGRQGRQGKPSAARSGQSAPGSQRHGKAGRPSSARADAARAQTPSRAGVTDKPQRDSAQAARRDVRPSLKPVRRKDRPVAASPTASGDARTDRQGDVVLRQWLRQIPDDPAGLLRRKFMLDHLRQEER